MKRARDIVWFSLIAMSSSGGCGGQTSTPAAGNSVIRDGSAQAAGGAVADAAPDDGATDADLDQAPFPETSPNDTGTTESGLEEAATDAPEPDGDSGAAECTPGERLGPCNASATGCPGSYRYCGSDGTWDSCECIRCTVPLDAAACSWTFESPDGVFQPWPDMPSERVVTRIDEDGGTREVPYVHTEGGCTADGGWYFTAFAPFWPTSITLSLCPVSCADHQRLPAVRFEAESGPCPNY